MNKKIILLFFISIILASHISLYAGDPSTEASTFEDEFPAKNEIVSDPLQPYNRIITSFNDRVYLWGLKPTATGYSKILPETPRIGIRNFFHNLMFPIRFVNTILQLKFEKAGIETARFVINSVIGVAGFGDPAKSCFNLKPHNEDFGQTLGFYGTGSIFHIDWPFIGPSNLRDSIGFVGDMFLNPINYLPNTWVILGINIFEKINKTSLHLGEYTNMKKESVDYYMHIRDAYEQYRNNQIKK
jgi:phospholipid-binding lipoprotein MlaA